MTLALLSQVSPVIPTLGPRSLSSTLISHLPQGFRALVLHTQWKPLLNSPSVPLALSLSLSLSLSAFLEVQGSRPPFSGVPRQLDAKRSVVASGLQVKNNLCVESAGALDLDKGEATLVAKGRRSEARLLK